MSGHTIEFDRGVPDVLPSIWTVHDGDGNVVGIVQSLNVGGGFDVGGDNFPTLPAALASLGVKKR